MTFSLKPVFACLALSCMTAAAADFLDANSIWDFTGETLATGSVRCYMADAPNRPGKKTLKITFRKTEEFHNWLDVISRYAVPKDWSKEQALTLDFYSEAPEATLMVKIMGDYGIVLEKPIHGPDGKPPKAFTWHKISIPLPKDTKLKSSVNFISVYMYGGNDKNFPPNTPITFYLGLTDYKVKPRVPWPPSKKVLTQNTDIAWDKPFTEDGTWYKVGGKDNQNDHLATIANGKVIFDSTAKGWNEFIASDSQKLVLEPNTTYRLDFDYAITKGLAGTNPFFYCLVRCPVSIREDVGWQRWKGSAGTKGHSTVIFTTKDFTDYRVIFGIHDMGAIEIGPVRIDKLPTK